MTISTAASQRNTNTTVSRMLGKMKGLSLRSGENGSVTPDNTSKPSKKEAAGLKHYVLKTDLQEVPEGYEVCVFGNGCFWGSEKAMWRLPKGIHSTAVGYAAGKTTNPTYTAVCSGTTGHTEGVRVVFNPKEISYVDILRMFWESHDPTQFNGQGNDIGTQYRSGIFYFNDDQRRLIEASKAAYEKQLGSKIKTQIAAASDYEKYGGLWHFAEPLSSAVSCQAWLTSLLWCSTMGSESSIFRFMVSGRFEGEVPACIARELLEEVWACKRMFYCPK